MLGSNCTTQGHAVRENMEKFGKNGKTCSGQGKSGKFIFSQSEGLKF